MLTLFPRIKPNPLPPPPLPSEPLEATPILVESSADVNSRAVEPGEDSSVVQQASVVASPAGDLSPATSETASPASSVTDSDLFAAFMSGMATSGVDPFIVEITAQPPKSSPVRSESEQPPQSASAMSESAATVEAVLAKSPESVEASSQQNALVPEKNEDVAITDVFLASENLQESSRAPQLYIAAANIFDELDILHEAAIVPAESASPSPLEPVAEAQADALTESPRATNVEAASKGTSDGNQTKSADESKPVLSAEQSAPAEIASSETVALTAQVSAEPPDAGESAAPTLEPSSIEIAPSEPEPVREVHSVAPQQAEQEEPAPTQSSNEIHASTSQDATPAPQEEVAAPIPAPSEPAKKIAFGARLLPPKPRCAKGTFGGLARVPEPEAMEDVNEVEAYSSAAAQAHLDAIDDTFVAHAQLLLKGRERGRALDIGTGPGQIVIKLGYRLSLWKFVGVDRSAAMIEKARESLATAGELAGRVEFRIADGNTLDCPDRMFDLVVCNSVLHHLGEPHKLFAEIARVVKPGGAILLRDLRRPSRWGYSYHVWKHGKHYAGEMRRLFMASVMSSYTEEELQKLIASSALRDVRVFRHGKTHIGFERPIASIAERKR